MRTVLMSFKPRIYEKLRSGEKIYEYRRQYCDEETMVYMYVSTPVKEIKGILHLGKRIDILSWKNEYSYDKAAMERIDNYVKTYRYGMPVISFQETSGIPLKQLQSDLEKFVVPQSYYYLDNYPDLLKYVTENIEIIGDEHINSFDGVLPDNICLSYE